MVGNCQEPRSLQGLAWNFAKPGIILEMHTERQKQRASYYFLKQKAHLDYSLLLSSLEIL